MCGRYWIGPDDSSEQLKEIIAALNRRQAEKKSPQTVKTGEIFPMDTVPVVANSRSMKQTPFLMQWGFSGFGREKNRLSMPEAKLQWKGRCSVSRSLSVGA